MPEIEVIKMDYCEDNRGRSMSIPAKAFDFLGDVVETHISEIKSETVRGNHWHDNRNEVMIVQGLDAFEFAWSSDNNSPREIMRFDAGSFVTILIPRLVCHAIKNCGQSPIWVTAISDGKYDGVTPDTYSMDLL